MTTLLDCAWCKAPMEVKSHWTYKLGRFRDDGSIRKKEVHMVTGVCLNEHWYAGPEEDLLRAQ